jgi:hypothetical protein
MAPTTTPPPTPRPYVISARRRSPESRPPPHEQSGKLSQQGSPRRTVLHRGSNPSVHVCSDNNQSEQWDLNTSLEADEMNYADHGRFPNLRLPRSGVPLDANMPVWSDAIYYCKRQEHLQLRSGVAPPSMPGNRRR